MQESHTAENLSEFQKSVVDEWGLKRLGENAISNH
jgi:hypothetical protein